MITIEIFAYHLRQKCEIDVDLDSGVQVLQDAVLEGFGIPHDHQRLYFNGTPMESQDILAAYPFVENTLNEVMLLIRPLGKLPHADAFLEASIGDMITEVPDVEGKER
eukprot:TRINITY_DN14550_c1_g1_i1.p1 TRINITY_DN14550_c1_g1~~TRINITY_DN14550_c1_g1_i1.p1  ORF type:complete len:108 (+),score=23.56 TRINITY_DN14550_c1_g1_i1:281-604(+)